MKRARSVTGCGGSALQPATRFFSVDDPGPVGVILLNAGAAPCRVARMVAVQGRFDLANTSRGTGGSGSMGAR